MPQGAYKMASNRYLVAVLCAVGFGIAAPAFAQSYYCTLKETGRRTGWISPDMYVHIAADAREIVVEDAVMQHFGTQSVNAKVGDITASGILFRWSVDTRAGNQWARIEYRATLSQDSMKIRVQAKPTGYSNEFEARGTCKKV